MVVHLWQTNDVARNLINKYLVKRTLMNMERICKMNTLKKSLVFVMAILILASHMPALAIGTSPIQFSVTGVTGRVGDIVEVELAAAENTLGFNSFMLDLIYDKDYLKIMSCDFLAANDSVLFTPAPNYKDDTIRVIYNKWGADSLATGEVISCKFEIIRAPLQTTELPLFLNIAEVFNSSGEVTHSASATGGTVTVLSEAPLKELQTVLKIDSINGKVYGDAPFQLSTTGGSGSGMVTYALVSGPATVSASGLVTLTGAGNIVVTATKAADDNYTAITSAPLTIAIAKASQAALTIATVDSKTVGDDPFQLSAVGGSTNGAITYSLVSGTAASVSTEGLVTIADKGTVVIRATMAGDNNHRDVSGELTFTVAGSGDEEIPEITGFKILLPSSVKVSRGKTISFAVTWEPVDAHLDLTITVSNPNIISAMISGTSPGSSAISITGMKAGSAVVTVAAPSGEMTSTIVQVT